MSDESHFTASPESREQVDALVGAFLEEKSREREEERARQRPRRGRPILTAVLVVLCGAAWIAPTFLPQHETAPSTALMARSARITLYLASLDVRAFHDSAGRFPTSLDEAGADTAGIAYTHSAGSEEFALSTLVNGQPFIYHASTSDSAVIDTALRMRTTN